jgi:hypothetical protein
MPLAAGASPAIAAEELTRLSLGDFRRDWWRAAAPEQLGRAVRRRRELNALPRRASAHLGNRSVRSGEVAVWMTGYARRIG